jgi:hypothetical protein
MQLDMTANDPLRTPVAQGSWSLREGRPLARCSEDQKKGRARVMKV